MKKTILFLSLLLSSMLLASTPDDVLGLWITEKGDNGNQLIVEIYKTPDNLYNGRIKDMTIPIYTVGEYAGQEKMDLKNKDEKLKHRKLKGIDFVYSFKYDPDDDEYEDGNIYNPENGKEYYSTMEFNKDGTLTVEGSIDKMGWFGKKQIWKRLQITSPN